MANECRLRLLIEASLVIGALRHAGPRGLDWRGVAGALFDHREAHSMSTDFDTVRRNAYRWMDALEQAGLVDRALAHGGTLGAGRVSLLGSAQ